MLQVQSLACRRGGREIFRGIEFALNSGDALLVTGANGSGKSSLLRVLAGLLPSTRGAILWQGKNITEDRDGCQSQLHYIGHLDAVKQELTVAEMLDYWRALSGFNLTQSVMTCDPFDILALREKPIRYLSAGQKRRLTLSRLVCSEAILWLLDEPTTALDQRGQEILSECIAHHQAKGGMAVIATHQDIALSNLLSFEMNGSRS